ncbi:acyltransferase family protein [Leifsonia sp. fls2-241-R2A-40a]|uniref:acyltransferase family protein n=1 Tax=Leifsonia sp. fls2-241-R2A-40a TaxID=3040290 RepID=UPI0025510176|nr:acyltransferase family protein [Leifsonia sp. fls2-241-R2A-40a]
MDSIRHFPAVDGARGVAILSVLLYHSGWSTRGLFGVDVFFVISGFLITILLMKEVALTGRVSLRRFYARRAKRLLPGLLLTLALVLLAVWWFGTPSELRDASATALASLLQVANWQQVDANIAYAQESGAVVPFGQMWSLSVTEQFYIVWPLLALGVSLLTRRRLGAFVSALLVLLIAASCVAPLMFDGTNYDRLYLGADSRAVAFVAGGFFAALIVWIRSKKLVWAGDHANPLVHTAVTSISLAALGVVVIASIATDTYQAAWLYQGGLAGVAATTGLFIATLCLPSNHLNRFFSFAPFQIIGRVSYSMFLLHMPVYWLIAQEVHGTWHPLAVFVVGGVLTLLLSLILHHLVTEPLRRRSWKPVTATISIVVAFSLVAAGAVLLPVDRESHPRAGASTPLSTKQGDPFAVPSPKPLPAGHAGGPYTVAVIGDSVAVNMYEALSEYGSPAIKPLDVTRGSCGIFDADLARGDSGNVMDTKKYCWDWKERLRAANAQQPDAYLLRNRWDVNDQLLGGTWVSPCTPAWQQRYAEQLELIVAIGAENGHLPQIILSNSPAANDPTSNLSRTRMDCVNRVSAAIAARHDNVHLLDFEGEATRNGEVILTDSSGRAIYRDGAHFNPDGLRILAPWLEDRIARIATGG